MKIYRVSQTRYSRFHLNPFESVLLVNDYKTNHMGISVWTNCNIYDIEGNVIYYANDNDDVNLINHQNYARKQGSADVLIIHNLKDNYVEICLTCGEPL